MKPKLSLLPKPRLNDAKPAEWDEAHRKLKTMTAKERAREFLRRNVKHETGPDEPSAA